MLNGAVSKIQTGKPQDTCSASFLNCKGEKDVNETDRIKDRLKESSIAPIPNKQNKNKTLGKTAVFRDGRLGDKTGVNSKGVISVKARRGVICGQAIWELVGGGCLGCGSKVQATSNLHLDHFGAFSLLSLPLPLSHKSAHLYFCSDFAVASHLTQQKPERFQNVTCMTCEALDDLPFHNIFYDLIPRSHCPATPASLHGFSRPLQLLFSPPGKFSPLVLM
ncbi:protein N-lysine methyltransferase METTL21A isoform X1 [Sapajus apella]|uniref:Protein N-lysine methyltransferase METTL21A isoform X1 n=1 Tax=Sapajus apella TaxID=9515 RepID=A0A6J3HWB8_SAPAP|nr:protein N-lysine methyltransferase METTL21A isoform X1 [Sapajus apella]